MRKVKQEKKETRKQFSHSRVFEQSLLDSMKMLNPFTIIKNPILFVTECSLIIMVALTIKPDLFGSTGLTSKINLLIAIIILSTIIFSNFAESLAKNYSKAYADSLRIIHGDIEVKKIKLCIGGRRRFCARFIHLLNNLKRKHNIAHFVCFSVPHEFHFLFFIKQKKTEFIGKRFPLFQKFYNVTEFVIKKFH